MIKRFIKKNRNQQSRDIKPLILIIAEKSNITESKHFASFQKWHTNHNFRVLIPGHATDPDDMLQCLENYWIKYGLDETKGDSAYVVLNLDEGSDNTVSINKLSKKSKHTSFIISNPNFEVWFLIHHCYST